MEYMKKELLKYIGPGILITVGCIDPGNWATNVTAGAQFGYALLWVVLLATIVLVVLQNNAAHLGLATGLCMSENTNKHLPGYASKPILWSAILASIMTMLAELIGIGIALQMLFNLPIIIGSFLGALAVLFFLFSNNYTKIEKIIISFVSIIGFSLLIQLIIVNPNWTSIIENTVTVTIPPSSGIIILGIIGAVVMPHNIFLHSEVIQNKNYDYHDEENLKKFYWYRKIDTIIAMTLGLIINMSIIIIAAHVFNFNGVEFTSFSNMGVFFDATLGQIGYYLFAIAFLFAGIAAAITCGMASGSIYAGMKNQGYDIKNKPTKIGIILTLVISMILICLTNDVMNALLLSQAFLCLQLPITLFLLLYLTSSKKIMGKFVNDLAYKLIMWFLGVIILLIDIYLVIMIFS